MIKTKVHTEFHLDDLSLFRKGKVRNVYDFGDQLLIVSSDRVSAFDHIIDTGIPNKGKTLTQLSEFWFNKLNIPNHYISTSVSDFPEITHQYQDILEGRSMLVKKTQLIPIECVVRGYIIGSGWKDYQKSGSVCGHKLPNNLQIAEKLPQPIFTPASKSHDGHDENISIKKMKDMIGSELTTTLENMSFKIYNTAYDYAYSKGIIIADTKFEFGLLDDKVILIDEVLTPDSSRFWPKKSYKVGISPPSFDKQIVRNYIASTNWDQQSKIPSLPDEIIQKTANEYQQISNLLMNK